MPVGLNFDFSSDEDGDTDQPIAQSMQTLHLGPTGQPGGPTIQTQATQAAGLLPAAPQPQTLAALQAALWGAQAQLQQLQNQNATLMEENMNLSNKQKTRRRRSKTPVINTSMDRDSDSDASLSPEEFREKYLAAAADIGRQYALRCCPWMPKVFAHKLEHGRPTMDPEDPAQRFINEKTETTARLVQAWLFLAGNKYVRRQLGYDAEIATRFAEGVNSEKCKFVNTAVNNIPIIFGDLKYPDGTPVPFTALHKGSDELKALGPKNKDDLFCEVLMDPDHKDDGSYLFRSLRLVRVLRGGNFGQSAARENGPKTTNTKGNRWNFTVATPGAIAFGAVVLIYLTSGDDQFVPMGSSKVTWDYPQLFSRYIKLIMQNLQNPGIRQLFRWLNREVYGNLDGDSDYADQADEAPLDTETLARNEAMLTQFGMEIGTPSSAQSHSGDSQPPASPNSATPMTTGPHVPIAAPTPPAIAVHPNVPSPPTTSHLHAVISHASQPSPMAGPSIQSLSIPTEHDQSSSANTLNTEASAAAKSKRKQTSAPAAGATRASSRISNRRA